VNTPELRVLDGGADTSFLRPVKVSRPLGHVLVEDGYVTPRQLEDALDAQRRMDVPLGRILRANGALSEEQLYSSLAEQYGLALVDLQTFPPEAEIADLIAPQLCVAHGIIPWMRRGGVVMVATSRPDRFAEVDAAIGAKGLRVMPVLAREDSIAKAQGAAYGATLAHDAEYRLPGQFSCRGWGGSGWRRAAWCLALGAPVFGALLWNAWAVYVAMAWFTVATLIISMGLKITAVVAFLVRQIKALSRGPDAPVMALKQPHVSIIVPLLRETEIADVLVRRLSCLTYPKALLDLVLVLEENDELTRATLARSELPSWMRVIEVPAGASGLTTKPRALNYALDFCRGSIVGIWDAEDAPEPDQIEKVVARFQTAGPQVACLQGRLDYYNPKANWIARCFTIEYATWWRLVMPGVAQLGLPLPLGGTTLFFRRDLIERLAGWDAHNVTEDADLGIRLARAGYSTELIDTTTFEEANCRAWPWVRQRSRWLKGFAITWSTHMRRPAQLLRDLGLYRFIGLQVFFFSALSPFLLTPMYWSFLLMSLGLVANPFGNDHLGLGVLVLFVVCELASLTIHIGAARRTAHKGLWPWALTMTFYFQLGCIAVYKAVFELLTAPFYWDKTEHGVSQPKPK